MKLDRNYKMAKATKIALAFIADPHYRGIVKNLMSEVEVHSEIQRKKKLIKVSNEDWLLNIKKEVIRMAWNTPTFENVRFGFEVTMYIYNH